MQRVVIQRPARVTVPPLTSEGVVVTVGDEREAVKPEPHAAAVATPRRDRAQWTMPACDDRTEENLASPTIPSWNQISEFLTSMRRLRDSAASVA